MKLSIITVNLNNKEGLQKTIDSVVSQTFKDFEWIVIDGGSTDGSKELIEKYSDHISYWVSEPDKGIYNAMNKGIGVAKGEYLEFLNSGDYLNDHNTLSEFFSVSNQSDILYGNTLLQSDGKLVRIPQQKNYLTCYHMACGTICHPSAFIKKKLFDDFGLYDETLKIVSDWKFFFETIIIRKCSISYYDIDIVVFDNHGISSTNTKQLSDERIYVLKQYLPDYAVDDYISRLETNELLNHRLSRIIISIIYRLVLKLEEIGLICKCR